LPSTALCQSPHERLLPEGVAGVRRAPQIKLWTLPGWRNSAVQEHYRGAGQSMLRIVAFAPFCKLVSAELSRAGAPPRNFSRL